MSPATDSAAASHTIEVNASAEHPSGPETCRCVHELIAEQSRRHPERLAVQDRHRTLSYQALEALSDTMAARLRADGVRADMLVGVCLDPDVDLIVTLLGILKAGGAYVPLDPDHPAARLAQIAGQSRLTHVVTSRKRRSIAPAVAHRILVTSDARQQPIRSTPAAAPGHAVDDRQLAYVIHTSGSTGEPKGVLVEHRNLTYSTMVRFKIYADPVETFLLVPSFASDSSVAVIYWTLCAGGRLVLASAADRRDPASLARLVRRAQVTHVLVSPLIYGGLLEIAGPGDLHSLRTVIVAGEKCPGRTVRRHAEMLPEADLFNEYGPTEGAVWCSVHRCTRRDEASVPIGRALPGTTLAIVDADGWPAPRGRAGELRISGPGIARGYLDQPVLTAARFTPDPSGRVPGARTYATGDLTRQRADGVIEFIGRVDRQLKIGANRIEPGEIESVLERHPSVARAHVMAHEEPDGASLIAYCILSTAATAASALTAWLAERLPRFMVPRRFIFLKAFPLTANGKIDAARLPSPVPSAAPAPTAVSVSPIERRLMTIWEDLLHVRGVGITDSFVDLGGDSLRAVRLQTEVHRVFRTRLPLSAILKADRLCDLAHLLSGRERRRTAPPAGSHGTAPRRRASIQSRVGAHAPDAGGHAR